MKAEMVLGMSNVDSLITNRLHTSANLDTNKLYTTVVLLTENPHTTVNLNMNKLHTPLFGPPQREIFKTI